MGKNHMISITSGCVNSRFFIAKKEVITTKRQPLEGRLIGKWQILDYIGCDGKKSWYKCKCTGCGSICSVRGDKLISGRSTQCFTCSSKKKGKRSKNINTFFDQFL